MLQELSAKWQMAARQRGYCKFRAGSLLETAATAGATDWRAHLALWRRTLARVPFLPSLHRRHTLCSQLLRGIQLAENFYSLAKKAWRETLGVCIKWLLGLTGTDLEELLVKPPWDTFDHLRQDPFTDNCMGSDLRRFDCACVQVHTKNMDVIPTLSTLNVRMCWEP